MDEKLFWELIDELEEAIVRREGEKGGDGWHYDQANEKVAEVREKLQKWLSGNLISTRQLAGGEITADRIVVGTTTWGEWADATISAPRITVKDPE